MPRPQLAVGDYGSVSYSLKDGAWLARCRFRGLDGVTRPLMGSSGRVPVSSNPKAAAVAEKRAKAAALAALKARMDVLRKGTEDLNSESRVGELAEVWFTGKHSEGLKYRTIERARSILDNHILRGVGSLRIREASTAKLDLFIRDVAAKHGAATAVIVRSVLSGMFGEAQRYDAVGSNPVTATRVPKRERSEIRAMTLEDFLGMRAYAVERLRPLTPEERLARAQGDRRRMGGTNRAQTPLDVIDFLIGTGARASEVLGLCWEDVHLDGDVPFVTIRQQVIREKERGLVLAPTKERDVRRLALPGFAVSMLTRRQELPGNEWGAVFTNVRNNLIDPSNMRKVWRDLFAKSEWAWVTQKTLRKTVATLIDLELGSEVAAKQLGHASDSMTKKHYIQPSQLPSDQRSALESFGA